MSCFVSLPNSTLLDIKVSPKGNGQECMDQVCKKLGIIEQDYFGLQYLTNRSENLWLNLRNRLDRQLAPPYRLQLKVKYFVEPHRLLQPASRAIFYDQVKEELETGKLVVDDGEELLHILSYIAQADFGNFDRNTSQINMYSKLLGETLHMKSDTVRQIAELHLKLTGVGKESAQYKLLKAASKLRNYGVEYHDAVLHNDNVRIGVAPTGIVYYTNNMEPLERLEYIMVLKAEHLGKNCTLRIFSDNGLLRDLVFKMSSQSAANALYRSVTEMHSFFCCDTVHNDVSTQFSRDFKGMLASIFNVNTTLGLDYVFDIKRTSQEAYDHARRATYSGLATDIWSCQKHHSEDIGRHDYNSHDNTDLQLKQQVLEEAIEKIEESFLCIVCRELENSSVLCPCGHVTCHQCANKLSTCPLCRKDITHIQKVYLPTLHMFKGSLCSSSISLIGKKGGAERHSRTRERGTQEKDLNWDEMEVVEP